MQRLPKATGNKNITRSTGISLRTYVPVVKNAKFSRNTYRITVGFSAKDHLCLKDKSLRCVSKLKKQTVLIIDNFAIKSCIVHFYSTGTGS
jgi:hypothetical protein